MTGKDITTGSIYFAYCGSLVPVRVLQTRVRHAFPGQVAPTSHGVLVRTLTPVPDAADWPAAWRDVREPRLAHEAGEEFVIRMRDVAYLAERDTVPDAVRS